MEVSTSLLSAVPNQFIQITDIEWEIIRAVANLIYTLYYTI